MAILHKTKGKLHHPHPLNTEPICNRIQFGEDQLDVQSKLICAEADTAHVQVLLNVK